MLHWFDAHLDLAYLAERGRDLTLPPESCGGPDLPAAVTFPALHEGNVTHCLATIFTEADGPTDQPQSYPADDAEAANVAGRRQLARYAHWHKPHFYRAAAGLSRAPALPVQGGPAARPEDAPDFLILIEGADPILDPGDLGQWRSDGVVAVGLAWWKRSRYAGGNGSSLGLTDLGRELVREMDRLGVLHDASHLSDAAFWELCDASQDLIFASHSNCRALVGGGGRFENQRHLHDEQIQEIVRRGGVIGLNLYSKFLRPLAADDTTTRASIADCVAHIEHICNLAGGRANIGLGSDMDGGFSAARMPEGINHPRDLVKIADALAARGWSDADIRGFAFENFARLLGVTNCSA